jgi:hypothetical protein
MLNYTQHSLIRNILCTVLYGSFMAYGLVGSVYPRLYLVQAQFPESSQLQTISPTNAHNMTQLWQLGLGTARQASWSPDGSFLAVASSVGVWVYDSQDLNSAPHLLESQGALTTIAFSSNGLMLASGAVDGKLTLWDLETYATNAIFERPGNQIIATTFSPDDEVGYCIRRWYDAGLGRRYRQSRLQ